jgi:predicted transcriptional regulator
VGQAASASRSPEFGSSGTSIGSEVDQGLAAADRGEFVEHDDIRNMIDRRYPA